MDVADAFCLPKASVLAVELRERGLAIRERTSELLEQMDRAAMMIGGHLEGILAHWTQGLTTDFMEVPSSRLKLVGICK